MHITNRNRHLHIQQNPLLLQQIPQPDELALQAGLSTATIDRAHNNRPNVSPQTKRRVEAAISELETQESQLSAKGRRLFVDIVVEAPQRFSQKVKSACEAVLFDLGPAIFRPRIFMKEHMEEKELLKLLQTISKRGSQGVILKARDSPNINSAIAKLVKCNIPVITLVIDILDSERLAYVGLDNFKAGETAAYLISKVLGDQTGQILTTTSQSSFSGENERLSGFQNIMSKRCPNIDLIIISGGGGLSSSTEISVRSALANVRRLKGVFSMGGGNRAICQTLNDMKLCPSIFIAHDLDEENTELLKAEQIYAVLHHSLEQDLRHALNNIASHHGLIRKKPTTVKSDIHIITPMNITSSV